MYNFNTNPVEAALGPQTQLLSKFICIIMEEFPI